MGKPYKTKIKKFEYEVMLVVDGEISVDKAKDSVSNLISLFSDKENYSEYVMENNQLAYSIKGKNTCHRFILNFELEDPSVLFEFNRLVNLNKQLLRSLVINKTKDRGYRALHNSKKIKDLEIRQEKRRQYIEQKKSLNNISNAS